ncbi:MAG TPA: ABC transporter permease [Candidatus Paceibacterota bacterium]|nr:ABC transporter permease [Candidatus Paceibacterota bacterium]HRZ56338.1 ABC transporter permease [Candidatus Paceibacterota bacterium]
MKPGFQITPARGGKSGLGVLLAKDLRRARRNPLPFLIHLTVPLVITALLGLVFGGGGGGTSSGPGKIKFAIVDEDDSVVTQFLRGAVNQGRAAERLQPVFLDRTNGLAQVTGNELSAVIIIPAGFTRNYLTASAPVTIELVKNPAQSIYPAVIEELLGALETGLNALSRNFADELTLWSRVFDRPGGPDFRVVADQIVKTGEKIEAIGGFVNPPRVSYEKETRDEETSAKGPGFNLFAFLLPGLAGMFLLFLAEVSVRDVYREIRLRTFERFCTLPQSIRLFVGGKVAVAVVILLLGAAIMLGGGGLILRIDWRAPAAMALVGASYALFAVGFMMLLASIAQTEGRADALGNVVAMALGLVGGCAFPADALPTFMREHLTPLMPPNWFVEAIRGLQSGADAAWPWAAVKLAVFGVALAIIAAWVLERKLRTGVRA